MPQGFGEFVRERRLRHGWSMRDLARNSGLTNTAISNIEKGDYVRGPEISTLAKLAVALGIPLATMIEAAGYPIGLASDQGTITRVPVVRELLRTDELFGEGNLMGYEPIAAASLEANCTYFLTRVTDESLNAASIVPGQSWALVKRSHLVCDGALAAVVVGGEPGVLRYTKRIGDRIMLWTKSLSDSVVVPASTVQILGPVVTVITYAEPHNSGE